MTSFSELNLNTKIVQSLENKGYTTPTPIQAQAIPSSLEGKDILGIAQTGTGKTAAFSLPILHNLSQKNIAVKSGGVRSLILTPTRELASQIADNIEAYGAGLGLRHAVIFGGVSENSQIKAMQAGVDILIATPGRLLDLMSQGYIRFMQLEIFVLDEADRMLDMGFINDIKKIIAKIPTARQTMFFSATMPATISDLAHSILKDPVKIEITPQATTVERIQQKINFVEKGNKLALLKRIISEDGIGSVLVFSKTKHGANRIVEFLLKSNISVAAIHGNKSQAAREKALGSFRDGAVKVLVATDIAARGIDIPAISHVVNFDIPMDPESYVHRIGRTARAGREGIAISLCDPSERKLLTAVEKTINYKIPVDETHPFHGVAAAPTERDSRRDDREVDSQKGRRTFGYSNNRSSDRNDRQRSDGRRSDRGGERRSEFRGERTEFADNRRSDRGERRSDSGERRGGRSDFKKDLPRRDDRRNPNRRYGENSQPDNKKSGLLDFIGLGRKKTENKPRRAPRNHITKNGDFLSINEKKGNKFGFSWFRSKQPDELNLKEPSDRDNFARGERGNQKRDYNGRNSRSSNFGARSGSGGGRRFGNSGNNNRGGRNPNSRNNY